MSSITADHRRIGDIVSGTVAEAQQARDNVICEVVIAEIGAIIRGAARNRAFIWPSSLGIIGGTSKEK